MRLIPDFHSPFILLPNRVWRAYLGGQILDEIERKIQPIDGHFPEDWIGSTTRAANPPWNGFAGHEEGVGRARDLRGEIWSIEELVRDYPEDALGLDHVNAFGSQPHLLVKLLDSAVRLHIQAHPSVKWARSNLGAINGKTEAWWILGSRQPDPWVLLGFQRPPKPVEWQRILEEQDLEAMMACFDQVPVAPEDVLLIEGGVPHAIGPGLFLLEVQEPTDYVVRCDFAHGGQDLTESDRTMGLGVRRVLDLFDYTAIPSQEVKRRFGPRPYIISTRAGGWEKALLSNPQTDRLELHEVVVEVGPFELALDGRFSILIVISGYGSLKTEAGALPLLRWTRVFLPAAVEMARLSGDLHLARCLPPLPNSTIHPIGISEKMA